MALCRKTPAKALITSCHRRSPETDHAPEADKNVEDSLKLLRLLLVVEEELTGVDGPMQAVEDGVRFRQLVVSQALLDQPF